ncbi:MAG: hypothetical protein LIO70_03730 [Clostridiales bacterium]|nr:hypothetical protein [Clostridiales bacterium]
MKKPAKLLYPTFDGDAQQFTLWPRYTASGCSFLLELWNEPEQRTQQVLLLFHQVAAVEVSLNLWDARMGADLGGFYELYGKKEKRKLLQRNFKRRKKGWLLPGRYENDPADPQDGLNDRTELNRLLGQLGDHHLYLLQSWGGSVLLLARGYEVQAL